MPRHLIACIDGTWNSEPEHSQFFSGPTNVARVSKLLISDGKRQRVLYAPGIGTGGYFDRIIGGTWGAGTMARVRTVYRSLCESYEPGDQIALFGFSRGAFAARAIAGLIGTVGLVRNDQLDHIEQAFSCYQNPKMLWGSEGQTFRDRHSYSVTVFFIGLWDTVIRHGPILAPVGWLIERALSRRFGLVDQRAGRHIRHVAHALALDEERSAFRPFRMTASHPAQTVQELWFAGSHSDVGGGYQESRPSEFSLRWIIERAAQAGLMFHEMPRIHEDAYSAPLNPSRIRTWRLLPSRRRVLMESDRIHESVHLRMRATSYRPVAKLPKTLLWAAA